MTTPRVTEIPIVRAAVEPDPFIEVPVRARAARRRPGERGARRRQVELVRHVMQLRDAVAKARRQA